MNSIRLKADQWKDRSVLVTGATGIIGSWLVDELLSLDAHVVAYVPMVDRDSELYRSGNIERVSLVHGALEHFWAIEGTLRDYVIDTVFHLGAQTIVGTAQSLPLATFETNIRGTYNILEACRLHRDTVARILVASSDKAYGAQVELPYTEETPLNGRHPYEVSKTCADLISQAYHHTYRLPIAVARCGNVYGGGDLNWSRIVPGTIRSFLRGDRPIIRSDGSYVRDYIYVKDIARAYILLANHLNENQIAGEVFNFGTELPMTVLDLLTTMQTIMNCEHLKPIIQSSANGEIQSQYLSAEKARRYLDWRPEYTLESGLEMTIDWYSHFVGERVP